MASSMIFPQYFDDFKVKVFQKKRSSRLNKLPTIEVQYNQWIDEAYSFHWASIPWNGSEIGVDQIEQLLCSAQVPVFIQFASAIEMILERVNQTLEEAKMNYSGSGVLPSIVALIEADTEPIDSDWDSDSSNEEEE